MVARALRPRPSGRRSRRAITLLELLIALAILVVMAALAAPTIHRAWERYQVKQAGDQLRAAFLRAHVEAMRTGQIQVLRFEMGGSRYYVQPWMAGDEAINVSAQEAYDQSLPQYQAQEVPEQNLPEGISFVAAAAKFDTRAQEIEFEAARQQTASTTWSQPILFYPDGTSSSARVAVANDRGEAVQLTLRKLTGLTTMSDVTTAEELIRQEAY